MLRRTIGFVIVSSIFLTTPVQSESVQFSITVAIRDQEVTSNGRATYFPDAACLQCRYWGNHRINGASAGYSWNLPPTEVYERRLSDWITDGGCYTGFLEAWASAGFYGKDESERECAPCVLWTEAFGSGSITGAPIGKSSYNCGTGITLTATPANGWQFVRWNGSISTTSATITFTLDASKSLTAFFEEIPASDPPSGGGDDAGDGTDCSDPNRIGCGSPILIDLGAHSYLLTSPADGVPFDLRDEGIRRQVSWTQVGVENAFLARDRNGNGTVDSGAELFGNFTPLRSGERARHGFEALTELDENRDGLVDASDSVWPALLLWTDRNHDGHSAADELAPISASPILALETDSRFIGKRDRWGNTFRYMSQARFAAGDGESRRPIYDVFLRVAP